MGTKGLRKTDHLNRAPVITVSRIDTGEAEESLSPPTPPPKTDRVYGAPIVTFGPVDSVDVEKSVRHRYESESRTWIQRLRVRLSGAFSHLVGPEKATKPSGPTVLWNLLGFIVLLGFGCVAVAFPFRPILITSGMVAFVVLFSLIVLAGVDLKSHGPRGCAYRRNLGNTVLTICLAIPFMTLLYAFLWYPNLNRKVSRFSQDTIDEVQFPAIALFQNSNWTSQATLRPNSQKCFLGWMKTNATSCGDLLPEQLVPGQSCNCKSGWTNEVIEDFSWQNTSYRYVSWRPTPALVDRVPTYLMTLQAFFTYNTSQSLQDSNATQSPSLWLSVYDPSLDLTSALTMGYTRLILIAANGNTAINLGLTYRQALNSPPAYDYDLSLSTNQNLNIVCDTAPGKYVRPCHVTLFIQIPTFDRRIVLQQPVMRWMDVAASAGAYFTFVQFLSWILSGQAMAT